MSDLRITTNDSEWCPKYYAPMVGIFCAMYIINQAIVPKMIEIGPIVTTAAIFTFPICAIITDLLTEIYGFNRARKALWTVVFCTALFALFTQLAIHLPSAGFWEDQEAFETIFALGPRIALAGMAAWIAGELINSFVMSKMKIKQNAKNTSVRFIGSTIVGQFFDSIIFMTIAFAGTMAWSDLAVVTATAWGLKVTYEVIALPLSLSVTKWLKRIEGVEHFDKQKISAI